MCVQKLTWDSNFWSVDIYHIEKIEDLNINQIDSEARLLIQALPNVSELTFIHKLENRGFKFIESKITLFKRKYTGIIGDTTNFKALTSFDVKQYEGIFLEMYGRNSRFDVFHRKKVNEFYYTWLVNSTDGKMDDKCIGYFIEDQLAGFVTYKIKNNIIVIGLLGVLPHYRGFGISQLLLKYVDNLAQNNSSDGIRVSTQGKNIKAINAYIKNGFYITNIDHWYYLIKGELK